MKKRNMILRFCSIICLICTLMACTQVCTEWSECYEIENISLPEGVAAEVGGIDLLDDGRLVFVFNRGEVYFYSPDTEEWSRFAEGLHNPLGVYAESADEIYVTQYPEITRLRDTNGDGRANRYETVNNQFGMSGNYHEFHFGLVRDEDNNFYSTLNVASNGAGVRYETRGEINPDGRQGRMFSAAPYRGWVIKTTPDGKLEPFASGFRSPNGILLNSEGNLYVTDNEGDWIGTSVIHQVEKEKFYGHPISLAWEEGWDKGVVADYDSTYFDNRRVMPAAEFPHGDLSNSPTQPLEDTTDGAFGPFSGQILIGEMNHPHLIRVMLEEVNGVTQGAAVKFHDSHGLDQGNNRMVFDHEGNLWMGQTHRERNWTGSTGIQKISWTGKIPMEVELVGLTEQGFRVRFARPVESEKLPRKADFLIERYYYRYEASYGSPKLGIEEVTASNMRITDDRNEIQFDIEDLEPGYIYEMNFSEIKSTDGVNVMHPAVMYTLHQLKFKSDEVSENIDLN